MKRKAFLVLSIFLVLQASCHNGLAEIITFNISGTYGKTPQGFPLFSEGDPFLIQGSFDTGIAPTMLLKNGATNLQSLSFGPFYVTYGTIVNLNSSIPLGEISVNYPSNDNAKNDNDNKNGMYFMESNFFGDSFYQADNYTELTINNTGTQYYSGQINYNYQERTFKEGDFTIVDTVHDEILLNITAFTTTPVPVPTTAWLLGTSLVGLIGLRRTGVM